MDAVRRYTVTSAIDVAIRLYRAHFFTLFLISLAVTMTWILLASGLGAIAVAAGIAGAAGLFQGFSVVALALGGAAGAIVAMVVVLVVWGFGVAATTRAATLAALGQRPGVGDAIATAASCFGSLLWGSVLASLLTTLAALVCLLPGLGAFLLDRNGAAGVVAMFVFAPLAAVVGLILQISFSFVAPAVVVERADGTTAVGRSWQLARGRRTKIFLVTLLVFMLTGVAQVGATMIGHVIAWLGPETIGFVLGQVCSVVLSVVAMPLLGLVQVLLYFDGRVDHEAFDVQMLAQAVPAP